MPNTIQILYCITKKFENYKSDYVQLLTKSGQRKPFSCSTIINQAFVENLISLGKVFMLGDGLVWISLAYLVLMTESKF